MWQGLEGRAHGRESQMVPSRQMAGRDNQDGPPFPRVKGQWGGKRAGYVLITHGALELG